MLVQLFLHTLLDLEPGPEKSTVTNPELEPLNPEAEPQRFVPLGGAAGRPGSTAEWWTSSPLRLQKLQPLSSGHGRLLSSPPRIHVTYDLAHFLSDFLKRRPGGREVLHR